MTQNGRNKPREPRTPPEPKRFMLRAIPAHLHARFKSLCARRGKTMEGVLVEFMRAYVREG